MAYLWQLDDGADGGWAATLLDDDTMLCDSTACMTRTSAASDARWIVLASSEARINGARLGAGIAVLRDRDEIFVGGRRVFFSAESLATVAPQPAGERSVFCARCKLEIVPLSPAVTCPSCGIAHHQSEEFPCWTYADTCAMCDQPTPFDVGFRWTPEEL